MTPVEFDLEQFSNCARARTSLSVYATITRADRQLLSYMPEGPTAASVQYLRILIVDDFGPWAHLLESILSTEPRYRVVCIASDGYAALIHAEKLKPDMVLLDINLPEMSGIDLARAIQRITPRPLILFVSQNTTLSIVRAALNAGGNGYVVKTDANNDLLHAIRAVRRGERFLSRGLARFASEL